MSTDSGISLETPIQPQETEEGLLGARKSTTARNTGSLARAARCQKCGSTWTGHRAQHCPAPGCCQTFSGTKPGDMHRVGKFAVKEGPDRRRCLTPEEMLAKGMVQDDRGIWHTGREWAGERKQ